GGNQWHGRRLSGAGDEDGAAELRICEINFPARAEPGRRRDCRSCEEAFAKKLSAGCDPGDAERSQRTVVPDRSAFEIRRGGAARVEKSVWKRSRAHSRRRKHSDRFHVPRNLERGNVVARFSFAELPGAFA